MEAADEVCAEAHEEAEALGEPDPESEEFGEALAAAADILARELDATAELGVPEEEAETVEQVLDVLGEAVGHLEEAAAAFEDGGIEAAEPHLTAAEGIQEQLRELADDLGLQVCGQDEEAAGDGGDDEPHNYGDDPELDALWDACEAGDGEACDELFFESPFGSVYEEFGDTCGGRFPSGQVYCSMEDLD